MEHTTLHQVVAAVGGRVLSGGELLEHPIATVDTDSRNITPEGLFIPLVGDRFDGHTYLENALSAGSLATLTDRPLERYHEGHCYIQVADTERALGDLARWYLSRFDIPVIAITGSVGKTTTKDMIAAVLSAKYDVLKTEGNFNNNIGLPLTIFRLEKKHQLCILEMGMDTRGEIDYLASIAPPDMAVITNIGDAHIERLGSREEIFNAKCEILPHIKGDGMLVLCGDDPMLTTLVGKVPQKIALCGGGEGMTHHATTPQGDGTSRISFTVTTPKMVRELELPAIGNHMIYPTLSAVAVAEGLGLTAEQILEGVRNFVPTRMRMNILHRGGGVTILDDSYNANPQSMRAAIQVLSDSGAQRKIAVLGDMFELGSFSAPLHTGVGEAVGSSQIDCLVAVGEQSAHMAEGARQTGLTAVYHCPTKGEAKVILNDLMGENTTFLVKASRGMAMEELVLHLLDCAPERG